MNNVADEFTLFSRIADGDLRPHLSVFNTKKGLKALHGQFYSSSIKIEKDAIDEQLNQMINGMHGIKGVYKEGDQFEMRVVKRGKKQQLIIRPKPNENEEQLFNLDIPPAPDEKSDLFLRIIQDEYGRIKSSLIQSLENFTKLETLRFYAMKNLQHAKSIARTAHTLEKKLKVQEIDNWRNPNTYIIYVLKKYLIYSIQKIHDIFQPMLNIPVQTEGELEDELYEMAHSISMANVASFEAKMNKLHLQKLYDALGRKASMKQKIELFKDKIEEQRKLIETKSTKSTLGVPRYYFEQLKLYKTELGQLLALDYSGKILEHFPGETIAKRYERISRENIRLKNSETIESEALRTTNFYVRLEAELDTLRNLLPVSDNSEDIFKDIVNSLLTMQTRKLSDLSENELNDRLSDLLRNKGYYISDQSRSGKSGNESAKKRGAGSLDITIRDGRNSGVIKTIVESMILRSCGEKNLSVKQHIRKLIGEYDSSGNSENYIIVFSKASNFIGLWSNYRNYVKQKVFNRKSTLVEFPDNPTSKSDMKVGYNDFVREEKSRRLIHIFVNIK